MSGKRRLNTLNGERRRRRVQVNYSSEDSDDPDFSPSLDEDIPVNTEDTNGRRRKRNVPIREAARRRITYPTDPNDRPVNVEIPLTIKYISSLWPPVKGYFETSAKYMKRLTAVGVSQVLYLRKFFDRSYFETQALDHLRLNIINDRCRKPNAQPVVEILRGCFKAIDEKRLKEIIIRLRTSNDRFREHYHLGYTYDNNRFNIALDMKEDDSTEETEELCVLGEEIKTLDVRESIEQLLRSLEMKCQSLRRLPKNALLKIVPKTTDGEWVDGFEKLLDSEESEDYDFSSDEDFFDKPGTSAQTSVVQSSGRSKRGEVLSMSISGQDDNNNNNKDDFKSRAYIRKPIKKEKEEPGIGVKSEIKVEIKREIKQEPI